MNKALTIAGAILSFLLVQLPSWAAPMPPRIPVIDVTDLYHPHQDVGDNFDLITAYALPELDLRAVVLDCTEPFRQPVAKDPGPGLFPDPNGPREPGFIPVLQLNHIFGRNVPCGTVPFARMESPGDRMLDAPSFQQQGIKLMLQTLRESTVPVHIVSFGSARAVAVAYNRDPQLFRQKLARLHLCAGGSSPPATNYIEWNVALDSQAIVCLLRSDLPIALYSCAANNANGKGYGVVSPAHSYDEHNTYYKLPDLRFIPRMNPPLRRYLEYALQRSARVDFLRAVEVDGPPVDEKLLTKEHYVWETGVWLCVSGRQLVRRAEGTHRIIPATDVLATDRVLPNELHPCEVKVRDDGIYEFRETVQSSNVQVYYRGDPRANETALQEALPALYLSFQGNPSVSEAPAAETYLSRLQKTIAQTRSDLTTLTESADRAAHEFLAGGKLWAAGRQPDFISEACGRAGGLMAMAPLGRLAPTNHDVVLYAVPGSLDGGDRSLLKQWREQGTTVIAFSSSAGIFDQHLPVDTVANIIELWTWTGEFVAACTRLERMPVLYQSYGLPGGPERGKKYQGQRFHDDLSVQPVAVGVWGRQYLDQIERMLAKIDQTQKPKLLQAAQWWKQAGSATTLVTGHMFPRHGQDPRAPKFCDFAAVPAWEDKELLDPNHPPSFVLYLGYQFAPRKLVEQAKTMGVKLVYCGVQPAQPPEPASNVVYLDPGWPLADGCVTVPGYDIPILPASGVIQAAVFWTIASERARITP